MSSSSNEKYYFTEIPWPKNHPENYEFCENINEPVYDHNIHTDFELPEFIVNLKFEKLFLSEIDLKREKDKEKLSCFLESGLAFTAPFKVLSDEGVRVVREIINYHIENSPHLSSHTNRQAWNMRGLGYCSRFIRDLNRCPFLSEKMSLFGNSKLNSHAMPMNYSHINIGVPGSTKKGKNSDYYNDNCLNQFFRTI
jgi:hypothetical protein